MSKKKTIILVSIITVLLASIIMVGAAIVNNNKFKELKYDLNDFPRDLDNVSDQSYDLMYNYIVNTVYQDQDIPKGETIIKDKDKVQLMIKAIENSIEVLSEEYKSEYSDKVVENIKNEYFSDIQNCFDNETLIKECSNLKDTIIKNDYVTLDNIDTLAKIRGLSLDQTKFKNKYVTILFDKYEIIETLENFKTVQEKLLYASSTKKAMTLLNNKNNITTIENDFLNDASSLKTFYEEFKIDEAENLEQFRKMQKTFNDRYSKDIELVNSLENKAVDILRQNNISIDDNNNAGVPINNDIEVLDSGTREIQ